MVDSGEVVAGFAVLLTELLVLLLAVSFLLALAVRFAGVNRIQRWLGGSRTAGTLKGMALGFLIPFCTYSAIPAFVGMIDARIRTSTVAGFLLAAPLLDPVTLAVLWLLFGWQATLAYAAVTAATVFVLALVADRVQLERHLQPVRVRQPVAASPAEVDAVTECRPDPFTDVAPWRNLRAEASSAGTYAVGLLRSLALPMTLAVALAALIVGYVPQQLLADLAGPDQPLAVPIAALLGAPFYVSTEAFLPIASALHTSGMGLGAAFSLTISAAGVNLPELALLSRLMTRRLLIVYAAAVVAIAVLPATSSHSSSERRRRPGSPASPAGRAT